MILNGTAVSGNMSNTASDVFLLTDSFGAKGELKLQTPSGQSINIEADSGLQLEGETVTPKQVDDQKINQMQNLKQAIVNVAVVDEEKIEQIMQKKIASGKLSAADVKKLKEKVISKKTEKLNSIIQNTKENSSLLGDVINNSKEDQAGSVLEKIMADKPEITGKVVNDVMSANPEKLEAVTKDNQDLLTNIVKTVVAEASEEDDTIGNIISQASPEITSKMMTEITETKQELAAQVISQVSEKNADKIKEIFDSSEELATSLTEAVANSIVNDLDGSDKFKKIFVSADAAVLSKVSAAVEQQDASITQKAVAELIVEDKEAVKNVIKKASKAGANDISESTMKTAILQGEAVMVKDAVVELSQEVTNQSQNETTSLQDNENEEVFIDPIASISESLNNSIEQAKEEDVEAATLLEEDIIVNLNTVLASPS